MAINPEKQDPPNSEPLGLHPLPFLINAALLILLIIAAKNESGYNGPFMIIGGTVMIGGVNFVAAFVVSRSEHKRLTRSLVLCTPLSMLIGGGLCFTL